MKDDFPFLPDSHWHFSVHGTESRAIQLVYHGGQIMKSIPNEGPNEVIKVYILYKKCERENTTIYRLTIYYCQSHIYR